MSTTDRKSRIRTISIELPTDLYTRMERYRLDVGTKENRFVSKGSLITRGLIALLDGLEAKK